MKSIIAFAIVLAFIGTISAQTDTTVSYLDKLDSVCSKESAYNIVKVYKAEDGWKKSFYYASNNMMFLRQTYTSKDCKILQGNEDQFFFDGKLKATYLFDKNKPIAGKFFYPNGKINGEGSFDEKGDIITQKGYDSSGNIIKDYIFSRESEFNGGVEGWIKYLQRNLRADVPNRQNAPVGRYSVMLSFIIDNEGKVSDVTASGDPGYGTKKESIGVVTRGPNWIPAIENGKLVVSRKRQAITFQVSNQ